MKIHYPTGTIAEGILQTRSVVQNAYGSFLTEYPLTHIIDPINNKEVGATYIYLGRFSHPALCSYGFYLLKEIVDMERLKGYLEYQKELFLRVNEKNNIIPFRKK